MEFGIKAKNAIKKIAAISTGAVFIGATMMSAVAAASDLSTFPAPFVSGGAGAFTIVVGQDALPADIIGAVDVGVGLQAASGAGGPGAAPTAISGETAQVEEPGNPLNLDEGFGDVEASGMDDSDLPTILADGFYDDSEGNTDNEEGYTQELNWDVLTDPTLVYDNNDDGGKEVGDYVRIANNGDFYTYELDFDTDIDFDDTDDGTISDDLENTQLDIQGKPYIITSVEDTDGDGDLEEIELLTGKAIVTLTQGDSYTFEGHVVQVTSVTDPDADDTQCGVSVDGETNFIDEGQDEEFDGLRVGVSDVFAIHGAVGEDACEVTLGSVLTKLVNDADVEINGEDIGDREGDPDVSTEAIIDTGVGSWGGFTVTVMSDDEINLGSATDGTDWTDPVFGNFKMNYLGLEGETEEFSADAATNDGTFTFTNNEGKEVELSFFSGDEDSAYFGEDDDAMLIFEGDNDGSGIDLTDVDSGGDCDDGDLTGGIIDLNDVTGNADIYKSENTAAITGADVDITDMEGTMLLLSSPGQTAHVVEITEIDTDNDQVSFKDVTYGRNIDDVEPDDAVLSTDASDDEFDISGVGTITLRFAGDGGFDDCDGGDDLVAVQVVDGNLANAADTDVDGDSADADVIDEGYETDGANLIVVDEDYGDDDGDDAVSVGVTESDDISDSERSSVFQEIGFDDTEEEMLIIAVDPELFPTTGDLADEFATSGGDDEPSGFVDQSDDNDNDRYAMTKAGSLWHVHQNDDGNKKSADAMLAVGEARDGAAFVSETGALFSAPVPSGPSGPATTQPFVGAVARLDTEVTDKTATNLILIGGPCVNRLTAEALGLTYPSCGTEVATTLGIPLDGAQIALWDNAFGGTKTAMTVIGVGPDETRAATEVLKRHSEFRAQLVGMKVNVRSTAGVITVSAPTVA